MSLTYIEIRVTSSATLTYTVPFTVIDESYIHVFIDGVEQPLYTPPDGEPPVLYPEDSFTVTNSNALITLTSEPSVGALLTIKRRTKADSKLVDFQAGAILTEADLDLAVDQVFHLAQESKDRAEDSIVKGLDGKMDAQGRVIKNLAFGTENNDAITKKQVDVEYPKIEVIADNMAILKKLHENLPTILPLVSELTDLSTSRDADELLSVDAFGKMVWTNKPDKLTLNGGYF